MKKIIFNIFLIIYSMSISLIISKSLDWVFVLNVFIFYISAYFSFLIIKFFTEVIETQLYCDEYFKLSTRLDSIFIASLFVRLILISFNLQSALSGLNVIIVYSTFNFLLLFIGLLIIVKKESINKVNWFKNLLMILPMIIYVIADIYSFKGGLS